MLASRHVRVTGRVQGVFFRAWTQQQANSLEIKGWVRNCPDGSVEAHLEGEQWAVQRFIDFLRQGPPSVFIEQVTDTEAEFPRSDAFEVRH